MKRSPLKQRTPLKRSRLRSRSDSYSQKRMLLEPGRTVWKEQQRGFCQCGCNRFSMHLERHHVVYEQHVRREGGDPWTLANSMLLHPDCHARHHSGFRRVPVEYVPVEALRFALGLLGEARSAAYFQRYYGCEVTL